MMELVSSISSHFQQGFAQLASLVANPSLKNYFYIITVLTLVIWVLEVLFPWRKQQKALRKDFWLDTSYMYFNMFLLPLFAFNLLSHFTHQGYLWLLSLGQLSSTALLSLHQLPVWLQLVILFILRDFIHWNVHRLLHRVPFLWEMHKVHHSVQEMGVAAHLRYHFGENIVYRVFEFTALSLIGFGVADYFFVYTLSLLIGHLNHANLVLPFGPFKYLFNSPQMHIWHHAKDVPVKTGVNFGLSLSLWDYLFRTAYLPSDGRDQKLGFEKVEEFPTGFWAQTWWPFSFKK